MIYFVLFSFYLFLFIYFVFISNCTFEEERWGGLIKTGLTQFSKEDGTSFLDSKVETLEVMQPGIKNKSESDVL